MAYVFGDLTIEAGLEKPAQTVRAAVKQIGSKLLVDAKADFDTGSRFRVFGTEWEVVTCAKKEQGRILAECFPVEGDDEGEAEVPMTHFGGADGDAQ